MNGSTETTDINNIWSHILQDVQNSTKKTPPPKSIILLGDNESGRTTLISRLKGVESISKGVGLEYHYIDVKDDDRDDTPKLGIWVPDGDGTCINGLLKFALNETTIENTLIVFVVSMSQPWNIIESLDKWSKIIKEHIKKLHIDEKKLNELRERQRFLFRNYQEPDENAAAITAANLSSTNPLSSTNTTPKLNTQMSQIFSTNKKDTTPSSIANLSIASEQNDDDYLPLDPSVLTTNLGVSTIVVVTKTDSMSILDKENEYRVEHFDFIQYTLRKFCLDYGAALFYTTVKDKRTYDKLYRYILHKLYNYPFNYASSVVDRESIFIPSGWDNESKINILLEHSTSIKADNNYSDVIQKPNVRKQLNYRDVETVLSMDDQDFLSKLQIQLNKATNTTAKPDDMLTNMPTNVQTTPPSIKVQHKTTPAKPNPAAPDSTNLKSFFQNLLAKNNNSGNPNASPTQQQQSPSSQPPGSLTATPTGNEGPNDLSAHLNGTEQTPQEL